MNPGSPLESLLGALRRGEREPAHGMASAIHGEIRALPGEDWARTRVRALHLALALGDAAAEGGGPQERTDAAMLRAAGEIAAASREGDLTSAVYRLLHALLNAPGAPEGSAARVARRAAAYVKRNYRRNLTLSDVARYVRLSPAYFSALFKREQGVGFLRFLREVRLAEARRLLRETDRTVESVANAVGYDDAHYFSRIFTREMGIPPGRYREQQRAALEE